MRRIALTGDELATLRGAGVVVPPAKRRNLRVLTHPRHTAQDRTILVTKNGITWRRSAKLRAIGQTKVAREAPAKRSQFAIGASYGESWQSKNAATSDDKAQREYWFRGIQFESATAMYEYVANLT